MRIYSLLLRSKINMFLALGMRIYTRIPLLRYFYYSSQQTVNYYYLLVGLLVPIVWCFSLQDFMELPFREIPVKPIIVGINPVSSLIILTCLLVIATRISGARLGDLKSLNEFIHKSPSFLDTHELQAIKIELIENIEYLVNLNINTPLEELITTLNDKNKNKNKHKKTPKRTKKKKEKLVIDAGKDNKKSERKSKKMQKPNEKETIKDTIVVSGQKLHGRSVIIPNNPSIQLKLWRPAMKKSDLDVPENEPFVADTSSEEVDSDTDTSEDRLLIKFEESFPSPKLKSILKSTDTKPNADSKPKKLVCFLKEALLKNK